MQKQGRSVRTPTKEKDAETEMVGEDTDQGERYTICLNAETGTVGEDTGQGERCKNRDGR